MLVPYALSGTDIRYGATRFRAVQARFPRTKRCSPLSAYAPPTRCLVLTRGRAVLGCYVPTRVLRDVRCPVSCYGVVLGEKSGMRYAFCCESNLVFALRSPVLTWVWVLDQALSLGDEEKDPNNDEDWDDGRPQL
eukprot:2566722-Rhodomonas_salina.1